jgi:hypothetical protein
VFTAYATPSARKGFRRFGYPDDLERGESSQPFDGFVGRGDLRLVPSPEEIVKGQCPQENAKRTHNKTDLRISVKDYSKGGLLSSPIWRGDFVGRRHRGECWSLPPQSLVRKLLPGGDNSATNNLVPAGTTGNSPPIYWGVWFGSATSPGRDGSSEGFIPRPRQEKRISTDSDTQ